VSDLRELSEDPKQAELRKLADERRKRMESERDAQMRAEVHVHLGEWGAVLNCVYKTEKLAEKLNKLLNAPVAWTANDVLANAPSDDPALSDEMEGVMAQIISHNVKAQDLLSACCREICVIRAQMGKTVHD